MRALLLSLCFVCAPFASAAWAEDAVPIKLGTQANQPHYFSLASKQGPIKLASNDRGHFLSLPSRAAAQPIKLEQKQYFKLPARASDDAPAANTPTTNSPVKAAAPSTPVPSPAPAKESDAAMHATVSAQAAISQTGQQLTDPIDLILAHAARKNASSRN